MPDYTYRCLDCREETIERGFNVSHVKLTCDACGEFNRFVHDGVYQQFQTFEETPPEEFDWGGLEQGEKFVVAENMVRKGKTIDDFAIEDRSGNAAADADD